MKTQTKIQRPTLKRATAARKRTATKYYARKSGCAGGEPGGPPSKLQLVQRYIEMLALIPQMPDDALVPLACGAAFLNSSLSSIERAIAAGKLHPVRGLGGHRSLRVGDLRAIQAAGSK
jgi:hypothetical protein